ncbi:MAG: hypothetical protein KJ634_09270 [Gammaproteobacteria bacterium]|nr:hypothetical protein [Gammaproteobacteria bacterium]MBU1415797.1 hypothetical protein [Gammaproteobacteria bacterium]
MRFRLRAFGIHLLASFVVLSVVLAVLYAGWYRWPAWWLAGAGTIVGVLVLVDVGVGPLATLIISSPAKPRAEWRRDIMVIAMVQVAALGYGAHSLWQARPLFNVLSGMTISTIQANNIKPEAVARARAIGGGIVPEWYSTLQWVWASLPEDPEERSRLVGQEFAKGTGVATQPEYYRSLAAAKDALDKALVPAERLVTSRLKFLTEEELRARANELQRSPEELEVLPGTGNMRNGTWVFDSKTGELLAFWPVESLGVQQY